MDSIVSKLSEIEHAAIGVVQGADAQKGQYDEEMKQQRKAFDEELATKTAEQIAAIQADLKERMDQEVTRLKEDSDAAIAGFEREYEEHHEEYAAEIIKHMTEV